MSMLIQIISAFVGSLGFALIFNVKGISTLICALGGGLTWCIYLLTEGLYSAPFVPSLCAAVFAAAFSEIMARIFKTPSTVFTATSIIPLVPGGTLYYTLLSVIRNNSFSAISYGTKTFLAASGIAIGIVVVSVFVKALSKSKISG